MLNESREVIASFRLEEIASIYKLSQHELCLNQHFLENFKAQNLNLVELIEGWWFVEELFKERTKRLYPIKYLKEPYKLVSTMFCRLYGKKDLQFFKVEWVPLIYQVVEKCNIFN